LKQCELIKPVMVFGYIIPLIESQEVIFRLRWSLTSRGLLDHCRSTGRGKRCRLVECEVMDPNGQGQWRLAFMFCMKRVH